MRIFRQSWLSLCSGKNLLLAALTGGIWLVVPIMRILSITYAIDEDHLGLTKGILTKGMDQVEWIRVKDVRMQQGIMGRLLNFGDVTVISTDKSDPVKMIKGVADPLQLRKEILDLARSSKRKNGVTLQEWL